MIVDAQEVLKFFVCWPFGDVSVSVWTGSSRLSYTVAALADDEPSKAIDNRADKNPNETSDHILKTFIRVNLSG